MVVVVGMALIALAFIVGVEAGDGVFCAVADELAGAVEGAAVSPVPALEDARG